MAQDRPAALVTGSASGIGRAAALRMARAGYDVAINYSRSADTAGKTLAELESLGGRHLAVRADVSDDAAVAALTAGPPRFSAHQSRAPRPPHRHQPGIPGATTTMSHRGGQDHDDVTSWWLEEVRARCWWAQWCQ
jgi:hypothetical protein